MREKVLLTLLAALLAAAVFQWFEHGAQYRAAGLTLKRRFLPCSSPITYSIGNIDPGFRLPAEELSRFLREAESAWEAAAGRNLFELAPAGGELTVNMIYDRRQAALDKLKEMGLKTGQTLEIYKDLKARYDELGAQLEPAQAALAARLAAYRRGEKEYNDVVAVYNGRGTATARQVRLIEARRAALEREFSGVKRLEGEVNGRIDALNALATTLNQLIVELNLGVEQFNREGAALGAHEEGLYTVDGGLRRIDIYKYADRAQVVRLLSHELGHALGLDHTPGPADLMYPVNRGGGLRLEPGDLAELGRACTSPLRRRGRPPSAPGDKEGPPA